MSPIAVLVRCPACGQALERGEVDGEARGAHCAACGLTAAREGGVLDFLGGDRMPVPEPSVNTFYEARPFPGYAPNDDANTLIDRSRRSPFVAALDQAIAPDARVLEAGCGTGQLSNFLALAGPRRQILAADACRASLAAADEFRTRVGNDNVHLLRADLFALPVAEQDFDVVICRGVVHHTADPDRAVAAVARHVAPGGHLVLGFYESIARLPHRLRRGIGSIMKGPVRWLDPILRRGDLDEEKKVTWIEDQYHHPLEWCLPFPRMLAATRAAGLDWVRSVPPTPAGESLFDTLPEPGAIGLLTRRWGWAIELGDEDAGLVCLVARRPA